MYPLTEKEKKEITQILKGYNAGDKYRFSLNLNPALK